MIIKYWKATVLGIAVFAVCLKLLCFRYCLYIPGILNTFFVPIGKNKPVVWNTDQQGTTNIYHRPNIVFILSDDMGFNDITFFGGGTGDGTVRTDNIDSIGHDGVSFNIAYAGHATCAPSRASLVTGRYATSFGYEFTPTHPKYAKALGTSPKAFRKGIYYEDKAKHLNTSAMVLPLSEKTVANYLKELGYRTLMVGKWHIGDTNTSKPIYRGFDEVLGFHGGIISRYLPFNDQRVVNYELGDLLDEFLVANLPYAVKKDDEPRFAPAGYLTDYLASEAAKAIAANKHRPFFLYVPFTAPHSPFQALKDDVAKLSHLPGELARVYGAMILSLDRAVGTILDAIRDNGLADNTLVIFTNDNGAPSYALQSSINAPFRGWKGTLFEGGIRVPMFMRWPGKISPGD